MERKESSTEEYKSIHKGDIFVDDRERTTYCYMNFKFSKIIQLHAMHKVYAKSVSILFKYNI